ncbi:MAG: hypothetical protein ACT4PP_17010 [Sporichthyaceae bacterium]
MSALILDAGAWIAIERRDLRVGVALDLAERGGTEIRSNAMVVAQVWRDPRSRQARLARSLRSVDVRAVTPVTGRAAGLLLAACGLQDAVDATVALLAEDGDTVLTSDPADLRALLAAAGIRAAVLAC